MGDQAALALLMNPQGQFLLTRRSETCPKWPFHWDLPGGYVEANESAQQGLLREVAEETGLFLTERQLMPWLTYHEGGVRISVFVAPLDGTFTPHFADGEHDAHLWTTWDRLPAPLVQPIAQFPTLARRTT